MTTQQTTVHPHLPRWGQALTGTLCAEAIAFQDRWVVVVAAALVATTLFAPKWSPVNRLFRLFLRPATKLEPIAPVRFAQAMALTMLSGAIVCLFAGATLVGWIIAGVVATVALFSAISGICVGCELYRLLMLRNGAEGDLRGPLGLGGDGPWHVVLTAPGCARCEPVARQLEGMNAHNVTRIDITQTPAAARLPVRSVPAVVTIGTDGHVREVAAGRLDAQQLRAVVAI